MESFAEWLTTFQPLYGALADEELYLAHQHLDRHPATPSTYRACIPTAARRALGEFYTPAALADQVLDAAEFAGQRMLDPACGAGAFLTRAGANATGWDINPMAVRMAREHCPQAHVELRDAFDAPERQFDFIAGNPPWINWRNLNPEYRARVQPLWEHYRLFDAKGLKARLGGAMDDISALMTYVCADRYLAADGRLAFLLPAPLFQSIGASAFRAFTLPHGFYLRVIRVQEIDGSQPFEGASTRPALAVFEKSRSATIYPVAYVRSGQPHSARPISKDVRSPWSVTPAEVDFDWLRGESKYTARIGVHTGGAAGVYWIDILEDRGELLLVRNRALTGRNHYPEVTAEVERDLVYPLLRGRDLQTGPSAHILLPHTRDGKPIPESIMRQRYPRAFCYFENFRTAMLERAHYRQHFAARGQPYWSMFNVGPYSFAKHRVAWREQSATFQCAVLEPGHIADAKLIVAACDSAGEANHLADFLNSAPARAFIESYMVRTQISTHIFRYLKVPDYSLTK